MQLQINKFISELFFGQSNLFAGYYRLKYRCTVAYFFSGTSVVVKAPSLLYNITYKLDTHISGSYTVKSNICIMHSDTGTNHNYG